MKTATLICAAMMSLLVFCGSPKPPPVAPRVIPVTLSCLKTEPPKDPLLPKCSLESQTCADEYVAAIIDYAVQMRQWGRVAWASCQVTP